MLASMLLVLLAPAPRVPVVEVELRMVTGAEGAPANAGLAERLGEGAAVLTAAELQRLFEEVQADANASVRQMPLQRCPAGEGTRTGFNLPGEADESPVTVTPRVEKGDVALEVRRVAARGKARARYEADLRPGETLLFRLNGALALATVRRVVK